VELRVGRPGGRRIVAPVAVDVARQRGRGTLRVLAGEALGGMPDGKRLEGESCLVDLAEILDRELRDCGPSECTVCAAALTPGCTDGSCNGP
jgi:hypothetical protein